MSEWISVDDRMPKPETDVLVTDGVEYDVAGIFDGIWSSHITEDECGIGVTHWQNLPELP